MVFELLVGPLVEGVFRAIFWVVQQIARLTGRSIAFVVRSRSVTAVLVMAASGGLGYAWGDRVQATGQSLPPLLLWSFLFSAVFSAVMVAGLESGSGAAVPQSRFSQLVRQRERWQSLLRTSVAGVIGTGLGFWL